MFFKNCALAAVLLSCAMAFHSASATARRVAPPRLGGGHHSSTRPVYGGGHHTNSHGGSYPGEVNANHKNGHYKNWRSANRYGVHKPS